MPQDFDDATLRAFADGKLDEPEFSRLVEALGEHPELGERIARLQAGAAPAQHDKAPAPARDAPAPRPTGLGRFWPLALAAGLAGVLVGYLAGQMGANGSPGAAPLLALDTPLSEPLRSFLADVPSGSQVTLDNGIAARALTSFVNGADEVCREFELSDATGAIVAVACAPGGIWQLRLGVAAPAGGADYAPASGIAVLEAYLVSIEAGPPLTGPEEDAALSRF